MPTFILGTRDLASTPTTLASGSNGIALSNILGSSLPNPIPGTTVHIDDIARIHIAALTSDSIKGQHEDFVLNANGTDGIVWNDALKIARKHFPDAVAKGVLPLGGNTQTARRKIDGGKAEREFGIQMKGFEEQIVSLVGQYVELAEKGAV